MLVSDGYGYDRRMKSYLPEYDTTKLKKLTFLYFELYAVVPLSGSDKKLGSCPSSHNVTSA